MYRNQSTQLTRNDIPFWIFAQIESSPVSTSFRYFSGREINTPRWRGSRDVLTGMFHDAALQCFLHYRCNFPVIIQPHVSSKHVTFSFTLPGLVISRNCPSPVMRFSKYCQPQSRNGRLCWRLARYLVCCTEIFSWDRSLVDDSWQDVWQSWSHSSCQHVYLGAGGGVQ